MKNFVPLEGPVSHSVSGTKFRMAGCAMEIKREKCSFTKKLRIIIETKKPRLKNVVPAEVFYFFFTCRFVTR